MLIRPEGFETFSVLEGGCSIFETSNNIASSFLVQNYDSLEKAAENMGVSKEKASDLVHDVFISLVKSEKNGEGYNPDIIGGASVEKFVFGRMQAYSKNPIYKDDTVEKVRLSSSASSEQIYACSVAASFDERADKADNDSFQLAYLNAELADNTEEVVEIYSVEEQMDYLLDVCNKYGIKIVSLLKNIDKVSKMLNSNKMYKKGIRALEGLREVLNYNDDAKEALSSVLEYSKKNRDAFESLLAKY